MGNGALPHGPSYRAHPRLYLRFTSRQRSISVALGVKRTLSALRSQNWIYEYTPWSISNLPQLYPQNFSPRLSSDASF
jgi:hypothetical protein